MSIRTIDFIVYGGAVERDLTTPMHTNPNVEALGGTILAKSAAKESLEHDTAFCRVRGFAKFSLNGGQAFHWWRRKRGGTLCSRRP